VSGWRWVALVVVAGAALSLAGVLLGAWWTPFPAGFAVGVALPRARWALAGGAVAGLAGWTAPLIAEQFQYGLAPTSLSLAAIMGFNGAATVPVALTVLVGILLGLVGAWAGSAARTVVLAGLGEQKPAGPQRDVADRASPRHTREVDPSARP
jgi:hypothetical protein